MVRTANQRLTPTQSKIMAVLSDGLPHTRQEIHACLWDEHGSIQNIQFHLSILRTILRPQGKDILVQYVKRLLHYRLVRTL